LYIKNSNLDDRASIRNLVFPNFPHKFPILIHWHMPSFLRLASVAVALLTISSAGRAQNNQPWVPRPQAFPSSPYQGIPATGLAQPGATMMPQERMSIVDPDKKLSAGDQVTVEIVEDREGGLPRVVTATGELDVPPLGR